MCDAAIPTYSVEAKDGRTQLLDVLMATGWFRSKGEARRAIANRGVKINGHVVTPDEVGVWLRW